MTLGVADGVWVVAFGAVIFNAVVALLINIIVAHRAYKRGFEAAHTANEAMALGRLMEASRERYYAGDALARALEESCDDPEPHDPPDPER